MKKLLFILSTVTTVSINAQIKIDTTVKVDLLRAPASPASNLLGFAPSDIERPTDVSAFMLSLQSASSSLSKLPSNYAVDIAPYWFFKSNKKGDITTQGLKKSAGSDVFKQTLVLSFAFKNTDSAETVLNRNSIYGGLGFKFYLYRGEFDSTTKASLAKIKELQDLKIDKLDVVMENYKKSTDPEITRLRIERRNLFIGFDPNDNSPANQKLFDVLTEKQHVIDSVLSVRLKASTLDSAKALQMIDEQIQAIASNFQIARIKFTWDVAGGVSTEFRNRRFDSAKINNTGLWTTIGFTSEAGHSILGLIRCLYNPDKIFAKDNAANEIGNIWTFDAGARYIFSRPQGKFGASLEGIYRSVLTSSTIDPSWRLVFNAEYAFWQNQKLTFSFGRNFDGTITKDGNLIAALTFLTGFGNRR